MASSVEYIQFVCEQIHGHYAVRYRKMFGEYMVYLNDKPVLLICDNTVYVKKDNKLASLMRDASCGYPYGGAKEHYILDIENEELTTRVLEILESVTQLPKRKR